MALKVMNDGLEGISAAADGAFYNFKTNGDFVFRGIGTEFAAIYSPTSRTVTIQNGEGVCGGRHVTEKKAGNENSSITLPANSSGYLSIRVRGGEYQDCFLRAASALDHGDINNGALVRDLPLYAYVTSANGITTFVDIRPISSGNGYLLRMEEDGELYADYIINGQKRHRKIITKAISYIDTDEQLFLNCVEGLSFDDDQGQTYYDAIYNALNVEEGTDITEEQEEAILACLANSVWTVADSRERYEALAEAWGEL